MKSEAAKVETVQDIGPYRLFAMPSFNSWFIWYIPALKAGLKGIAHFQQQALVAIWDHKPDQDEIQRAIVADRLMR